MIKTACAAAAVAVLGVAMAPEAKAEPQFYFNPEFNQGWVKSSATAGVLEGHLGVETENGFYLQAGPALATGSGETVYGVTGKAGVSGAVSESISIYSEVSAGKFDGGDTAFGLKVGSKFLF